MFFFVPCGSSKLNVVFFCPKTKILKTFFIPFPFFIKSLIPKILLMKIFNTFYSKRETSSFFDSWIIDKNKVFVHGFEDNIFVVTSIGVVIIKYDFAKIFVLSMFAMNVMLFSPFIKSNDSVFPPTPCLYLVVCVTTVVTYIKIPSHFYLPPMRDTRPRDC